MTDIEQRRVAYKAYNAQRHNAKRRGIGWEFSFESWIEWWGDDLALRGKGKNQLQMQRPHDQGPYSPSNARKGHPVQNSRTAGACRRRDNAEARKDALNRHLDAISAFDQTEPVDEDELELNRMFRCRTVRVETAPR